MNMISSFSSVFPTSIWTTRVGIPLKVFYLEVHTKLMLTYNVIAIIPTVEFL